MVEFRLRHPHNDTHAHLVSGMHSPRFLRHSTPGFLLLSPGDWVITSPECDPNSEMASGRVCKGLSTYPSPRSPRCHTCLPLTEECLLSCQADGQDVTN